MVFTASSIPLHPASLFLYHYSLVSPSYVHMKYIMLSMSTLAVLCGLSARDENRNEIS